MPRPRRAPPPSTRRRASISSDAVELARGEAVRQLANRERRDGLRALHDALWRALGWRIDLEGPVEQFHDLDDDARQLWDESRRVVGELNAYDHPGSEHELPHRGDKRCALPVEDLDGATRRILLERGASSYQVAAITVTDSADVGDSKQRKAAERAKRARLKQIEAELSAVKRRIETVRRCMRIPLTAAARWLTMYTWGDDAVERFDASNAADLRRREAHRDELQAVLDRLSLDRKSPSRTRR
jgi:hypothetical protein